MRSRNSRAAGAVRFDVLVTVVLIFILLGVLFDRLAEAQRASERTIVDIEVAALRTELQLAVASRVARGEEAQLHGWPGRNPVALAWGETNAEPQTGVASLTGPWQWNAADGVLAYSYRGGGCLQLRLARVKPGQVIGWSLGSGLLLVPMQKEKRC